MDQREQRKSQLENVIANASKAIDGQLGEYKDKGKNVLIIGGIIVAAYALSRVFSDSEEEEVEIKKPEESSFFGSALTGIATSVLLALAKNKILELIEQLNQDEEDIK